ncbi:hypothetical protein TRFO_42211 [Tritrichomonas foetus]|uniref:EF-hand domain-containing protein n=1 Tax=Tritrichomonas foetus TaxID=1144522 RepID=A0A1J4KXC7_9EUKA|nr:hypothetical protein TRFO_42211 [Tritrichomonas foetus]|eukprot:OHT15905.1 hypothetical protein TRFO_42211 [Tritrichomonas foetus]
MFRKDTPIIDYAKLIEGFRACDVDNRGVLTKSQYRKLIKHLKIGNYPKANDAFISITYSALCDENKKGITFESARIIYEASVQGSKTKLNSLILFRGIDDDRDGRINESQFQKIAKLVDSELSNSDIENLFQKCCPNEEKTISYTCVAKNLFNVTCWGEEDPFTQKLASQGNLSTCCLLL